MADYLDERDKWGVSKTTKETLDDYWEELLKKADNNELEEIKFFLHCTTLKGKKRIQDSRRLIGGYTNLPARAPLASYEGLKGIWLAPSIKELPRRSPYGTQRMVFKVKTIMTYLGKPLKEENESNDDDDDHWDAQEDVTASSKKQKGGSKQKSKKKKHREVNRKQKDCYLKSKLPEKEHLELPVLFFECAHYYGTNQYVRLILIRESDPKIDWCRETCKELNLRENPFIWFRNGRIYTQRKCQDMGHNDINLEVLVVGDILFDQLLEPPTWDEVGTLSRAGFDPRIGIC